MEEVSVAAPAGAAGLGACQPACIEGRGGFEPSMEEKDYSVATSGHHLASERSPPCGGVAGCEEDPWAGAEAPAPSWIGATRSDPGVGQEDMLSSPSEGRATINGELLMSEEASVNILREAKATCYDSDIGQVRL